MAEQTQSPGQLQCVVVTPEATIVDTAAQFVALPLYDGELGVAPLHSPMIGRLGYGELRIVAGGQTSVYYVDGGFVQVANDVVSILTGRALPAEQIDPQAANERLQTAIRRPIHTDELEMIRDRQIAQSRAQLRVARRAK